MDAVAKEHGFENATTCNTNGILMEGAVNYHHNLAIELCQRYGFDSEVSFSSFSEVRDSLISNILQGLQFGN